MASTYTMSNPYLHDEQGPASQNKTSSGGLQHQHSGTPSSNSNSNHLSPFSPHLPSNSASPTQNNTNTPAESISTFSQYHTSEYSDLDDNDPFFGVDFNSTEGGTPSFLDEGLLPLSRTSSFGTTPASQLFDGTRPHKTSDPSMYPLSPEQTASMHTPSPASDQRSFAVQQSDRIPSSVSPRDLQKPFTAPPVPAFTSTPSFQLTPDPSRSGRSSEEDLVPRHPITAAQSPRVTVSLWGNHESQPAPPLERTFTPDDDAPATVRGSFSAAGDFSYASDQAASMPPPPHPKDDSSIHRRTSSSSRRGLEPGSRTTAETASPNEMLTRREIEEKNVEVGKWLTGNVVQSPPEEQPSSSIAQLDQRDPNRTDDDKIPLGDQTENKYLSDQVYFHPGGGEMTQTDLDILHANNKWGDAPMSHPISSQGERFQPESSQAAIARYNKMWDNESIISKAATWGTRRRSLPSLLDVDIENVTSGKLLKKLTIARGEGTRPDRGTRRPSLLQDLRGLVRRPSGSGLLKRSRSNQGDESPQPPGSQSPERRDSTPHLAPPTRTSSWGNKKGPVPSINTALVSMGNSVASIGTTHARNGSISATPITSPRTVFNTTLQVKNPLRRPRSKSDLPKASPNETHSNLVGMWRKTGGPPVATLATTANVDMDDDDEDDDEGDDTDMRLDLNKTISDITPTFAGFQQHILRLNPGLETNSNYLVDRIAHQQIIRYKQLLNFKVKHLQVGAGCSCGSLCVAQGGIATVLDQKGEPKGLDPLSTNYDIDDGDMTPIEGAITQESFPPDIPMPLTPSLPAEFECQLCFQAKKFNKPSDWTKHVHEDVQPFTCTWDRCRDPKIFKRKADWVRHENEGHRHLEWWTCDVEDCTHTCYRRDNFLQHLVREHKFTEPKFKTKAAMKRQGADPTWQKVEQCHADTQVKPQDEPCRFCGKSFPSWKKLTVHLAKHMEQISLPVLRLVAQKELEPDTVISPVQDAPPRAPFNAPMPFNESMPNQGELPPHFQRYGQATYPPPTPRSCGLNTDPRVFGDSNGVPFRYSGMENAQYDNSMFSSGYGDNGQELHSSPLIDQTNGMGFGHSDYPNMTMPLTSYGGGQEQYITVPPSVEPFPALDANALGLHQPAMGQMPMDSSLQYGGMFMGQGQGHSHSHSRSQSQTHPNIARYAAQGRSSPYSRSPHQEMNGFYAPQ
ncbi:hypothetical protein ACHAQH_007038 [Verticillium albo-atrum]